tara:strand:- start:54522 stop:56156 length:1635 start_codon:yes stop_codon:yes gene_type:complete
MARTLFCLKAMTFIVIVAFSAFPASPSEAKPLYAQAVFDQFYQQRDGEPLWIRGKRLNSAGKKLYGVLQESWMHGFNPDLYYVSEIRAILDNRNDPDVTSALRLEVLLTSGYMRYVQDLSGMRVNASDLDLRQEDWLQRIPAQEALALLPDDLDDIDDFLETRAPQTHTYQRLKQELTTLVEDQDGRAAHDAPIRISRTIYPGQEAKSILAIRQRLDVAEGLPENQYVYDAPLVAAVKEFQTQKGLDADGIIGTQTVFAFNHGKVDKIRQIILNMERLRWIPDAKPDRFIVVNIPSARLWAIEDGAVAFSMPVVVGRKKRKTLSFITQTHGVRFNPTWTVPSTIKKEDILPHLQENPAYLTDKGMELFDGYGRDALTLDPQSVDWENISKDQLEHLNMVQVPGAHNPLGRIRILMPNAYNIYLHDTNEKSLFGKSNRAQSSGCVRMKDPDKVAIFTLKNRRGGGWTQDDTDALLKTGKLKDIYTDDHVPVYLLYYTVWLDERDQVIYGQDIYDGDQALFHALEKLDGIPIIVDNDNKMLSASVD